MDFAKSKATPELVVLATSGTPALAWRVDVTGRHADGSPAGEYVFVNARKGGVLDRGASGVEEAGTGTGISVGTVPLTTSLSGSQYTLVDGSRGGNATYNGPQASTSTKLFSDADNVWGNGATTDPASAGVDAHFGIATTWDYYKNDLRPQRHRQRRQGRAVVRPRRRATSTPPGATPASACATATATPRPTRWSRSTWPATR